MNYKLKNCTGTDNNLGYYDNDIQELSEITVLENKLYLTIDGYVFTHVQVEEYHEESTK